MRNVTIKKSELAMYKGLGQTSAQLAKRFGVSTSEISDALITFGMSKGKSLKKDYTVTYENDVDIVDEVEETVEVDGDFGTAEMTTEESNY